MEWNLERTSKGEAPLAVGLNHRLAVLGDVGSAQRMSFTVIGYTLNTAAGLQALTRGPRSAARH
jgi:class 3 adenylate cyclase